MVKAPRYLVIANAGSLRWKAYEADLNAFWRERGVQPNVVLVPWRDVVSRDGELAGMAAFDGPGLVRLESPGRDWDVSRQLLQAGCRETGEVDVFADLEYRKGSLVRPGLLYAGFRRVLTGLARSFAQRPYLRCTADPLEVAEMFDKNATCARLEAAGIPTPPTFSATGTPAGLLDELRARHWATAYVKLNTGSSASAIAVVRPMDQAPSARTTILRMQGEFWSTRRLQRYSGEALDDVLTFLLREGVCVQEGIRMAQLEGQNFDVRVVVIHGKPAFTIFRLSGQPMTNLHLGGRRGDPAACKAAIPVRAWLDGVDHCVEAARLYRSAAVGIDLLFEAGYRRHFLLEVNAFGDFFPGLVDECGRTVHRAEIEATV